MIGSGDFGDDSADRSLETRGHVVVSQKQFVHRISHVPDSEIVVDTCVVECCVEIVDEL